MTKLPSINADDFVRSSGGVGGGSVDVAAVIRAATDAAVKQAVPAAAQAATEATVAAVPNLVSQQTAGLKDETKQDIKAELKPEHLYAEYQTGEWQPSLQDVVSGAGNNAVFRFNFPRPFSTKPTVFISNEGTFQRLFRLGVITNEYFEWSSNYSPTGVLVTWVAYVPKV